MTTRLLCFLLFLARVFWASAMNAYEHFRHLTVNNGLARNAVYTLLQDRQGFMWFGAWDGLYRYDGTELRLMCHHPIPANPNDQIIYQIIEDTSHRIWMGTSAGLALWDCAKERLIPFTTPTANGDSIQSAVTALCHAADGQIWIGLKNGTVFAYDQTGSCLTSCLQANGSPITQFCEDKDGTLWVATSGKGAYRCATPHMAGASFVADTLFSSIDLHCECLHQDFKGCYWLGTSEALYRVNRASPTPVIRQVAGAGAFTGAPIKVKTIREADHTLYICTNRGLLVYDLDTDSLVHLQADYVRNQGLNDQSLQDVFVDREKGLWVATFYGGVNYCSPTAGNFLAYQHLNAYTSGHVVSCMADDKEGNIWMGIEDGGLCYWNRRTGTITNYNSATNTAFGPTSDNVQTVYLDGNHLYIGMFNGGMDIVDLRTGHKKNYRRDCYGGHIFDNHVYAFLKDSRGTLWIGTLSGLFRFLPGHEAPCPVDEVRDTKVNCLACDPLGNIWVSTLSKGLFRYMPSDGTWQQFGHTGSDTASTLGNQITALSTDSGILYVGTQGAGLWVFDDDRQDFLPIAPNDLGDKYIFKILPDGQTLWITTNKGLYRYNLATRATEHYTSENGLRADQFKINSGICTSDSLFVVGGVNGFNAFRAYELKTNCAAPPVVFTHLYLFNRLADIGMPGSPLQSAINYTHRLKLKQEHQQFAIRFAALSFSDPQKNKYRYRLEPFEKEWQQANEAHLATYTNLPAGNYTLHVQASNGNGRWGREGLMVVDIEPYWWLSLPMKTLYSILLVGMLLLFARRFRRKHHKAIELMEMKKEQELYRSKMEFFTCMVHELRTPITLIIGPLAELMQRKGHMDEASTELQLIERNSHRLLALVNQLMDFRKVEEHSYAIDLKPTDLCALLKRTLTDFQYRLEQRSIQMDLSLPNAPCYALIDTEALGKVMSNLLSNAIKFTRDRITVALYATDNGKEWQIEVEDNGCGISPEEQAHIFESFYQVRQQTATHANGTGIGLFLVRRLLTLQGGKVTVDSQPGKGTCFTVTIAVCQVSATDSTASDEVVSKVGLCQAKAEELAETEKRKHLLVVEDNDDMRLFVCSILRDSFDVTACSNGHEALALATEEHCDLIITDLMMPAMDGMELCRQLRSQLSTSHIPIIMLTAKEDEDSQIEGFEQGIDLYIVKPFSPRVLRSQIQALIRNRERGTMQFCTDLSKPAATLCRSDLDRQFIEKLDSCIEEMLSDSTLSVDDLAASLAIGRSLFFQKVKGISGLTPNEYIRTYRLKRAAQFFRQGNLRVNEVCYQVGFSSPSYFAKRFSAHFGLSPSEFIRNTYDMHSDLPEK